MAMTTQTPATPEVLRVRLGHSPMKPRKKAIWEWKIVRRAIWDAFLKLNPRKMMGNPVMFVVEIGSVTTTILLFKGGAARYPDVGADRAALASHALAEVM